MKLSIPFLITVLIIWIILALFWYQGNSCAACNSSSSDQNSWRGAGLSVVDGDAWKISNTENLRFKISESSPYLSSGISNNLDSLARHISLAGASKMLIVKGLYRSSEKNNTSSKNLGLARAEELKKDLIARGTPAASIFTASQMTDDLKNSNDSVWGAVNFNIQDLGGAGRVALSEENLLQPRTIYFLTGKNSLLVTPELSNYFKEAQAYLTQKTDKKLLVTGHTDNAGKPEINLALSKRRAEFVKLEMSQKGINIAQILADGKGDTNPIAPNTTAEGKAKNRRVEIVIQ